ncbi:hypothetical protein CR152_26750 [Massilia violaceinigra]|uniref:Uncharacterized protein n=2 Tax=Massilia violaceinigra TaxID=2045208 RepID=A0A2D2DRV8_9BURK|nr:hypothetical protein CR152_26750 [Massilia violaceinigra]
MFLVIGPYRDLPAKMNIFTRDAARGFLPELHQVMLKIGYEMGPSSAKLDCVCFQMGWGSRVKWLYGMPQVVEVCKIGEKTIEVRGPVRSLNTVHMFLRWKLGE